MISITFSSPDRPYNGNTCMPPPIYQYLIILVVGLPIKTGRGVLVNVSVWEHRVWTWTFICSI